MSSGCASAPSASSVTRSVWAFTAPWDARSTESATAHAAALDIVVTSWVALDTATAHPIDLYRDSLARRLPAGARSFALVTSYLGDAFHPETVRRLAADTALLARVASDIAARAAVGGHRGLVLDLEGLGAADLPALLAVAGSIRNAARARGIAPTAIAVPAGDTAAYPGVPLLGAVDLLLVMLYDEHWATSPPGPIASPLWVRRQLSLRVAEVGAGRIVASLPLYGYLWRGDAVATVIGFADAARLATEAGVAMERDPASGSLHAARAGSWELWVSDAVLLEALVRDAEPLGVHAFALWRLGLEDPAVWRTIVGR